MLRESAGCKTLLYITNVLNKGEDEMTEFRRSFSKETLRTLCAFANTKGGEVWLGIADDGTVVGVELGRESLRDWAGQIRQELGIHAHLETEEIDGKPVVRIAVSESLTKPVRYRGRAYVRSGSTDRIATDEEETRWVLERTGQTWDALPERRARWEHLDLEQIRRFRRLCNLKGRRPIPEDEDDETVLQKLGLLTEDGGITRAAVLLFGREPQYFYLQAFLRIGRFRSPTFVTDDHPIYGTLWDQVEGAMAYFRQHLQTGYGPTPEPAREVIWEYPLEALREAIVNAVCHRDYLSGSHIQVRWFNDYMVILSPGTLPSPLRPEDLKRTHPSCPRNRKIAEMFFYAGWIEQWGAGIQKILDECRRMGLPEPEWREDQGAIWLTFRKDIWTEDYLRSLGLNERQIKAVMWVKERGSITNREYRDLTGLSDEGARRDLNLLVQQGVLRREGKGRNVRYVRAKVGD